MRPWLLLPLLVATSRGAAFGQEAQDTTIAVRPQPTASLTVADALGQARTKSPAYLQVLNDAGPARWGVRNAYGNFLPSLNLSGGLGYTGSGESQFGAFFQSQAAFVSSNYQIGLQWRLDGRVLAGPSQRKALERATTEDIENAGVSLRADVTTQYLNVLAAVAQTEVAREQVRRNNEFLRLARARHQVGQATLLDVRQAEATHATRRWDCSRHTKPRTRPSSSSSAEWVCPAGTGPADRADRFVSRHSADVSAGRAAEAGRGAEPVTQGAEGTGDGGPGQRARGPVGFLSPAQRSGRLGRVHPAIHRRRPVAQSDARQRAASRGQMPVREPGPGRLEPRRGGPRLLWAQRARRRRRRSVGGDRPADPQREQRVPLQLYQPAVPGEPYDLAPDLHRVQPPSATGAGAGAAAGRLRERPGAGTAGPRQRRGSLPRLGDRLPSHRRASAGT